MAIKFGRRRAVVNLVNGKTLVGELCFTWPWQYKLRAVEIHLPGTAAGTAPTRPDGMIVVPRRFVEFAQIIT
jgi:hypothetical protein